MSHLWSRVRKLLKTEAGRYGLGDDEALWYRNEEREAEVSRPLCCVKIGQQPVVRAKYSLADWPNVLKIPPRWMATSRARVHEEHSAREVVVTHCPFCSAKLPEFELRKNQPKYLNSGEEDHCSTCGERNMSCYCSYHQARWEPVGPKPFAAVALIARYPKPSGKIEILSVSRKDNSDAKGLPGGKIERRETPIEALIRECREEAGITIKEAHLVLDILDDHGVRVPCYRVTKFTGTPKKQEAGIVEWVPWKKLIIGSPFAEYNRALFYTVEANIYGHDLDKSPFG